MAERSSIRGPGSRAVEELAEPRHPALQHLLAYWLSKKGTARAPPRSAIRPDEIAALLPSLAIVDVIGDPPRFRVRLFGTKLVAAYGEDITGKFTDEIDLDTVAPHLEAQLRRAVRECRPNVMRVHLTKAEDERRIEYERIWLPLSADGETVNMLLGGVAIELAYSPTQGPLLP